MKPQDVQYKALIIDDTDIGLNKPPINIKVLTRILEKKSCFVEFVFHQFKSVDVLNDYLSQNPEYDLILFDILLESSDNDTECSSLLESLTNYRKMNRLSKIILFSSLVDEDKLKGLDIQIHGSLLLRWINEYRVNGICPRNEEHVSEIICKCIQEIDPITLNLVSILHTYQNSQQKIYISGVFYSTSELIMQIRAQSDVGQDFVASLTRMMIAQYTEPEA
jgi:CheY-like chemotaxis protein